MTRIAELDQGMTPQFRYKPSTTMISMLTLFLSLSVAIYWLHVFLDNWRVSCLKKRLGCTTAHQVPKYLFGIFLIYDIITAQSSNRFLSYVEDLFSTHGNTFVQSDFGGTGIWTNEPRNIRECLSLKFRKFQLGKLRNQMALPLLGRGIFTSDGEDWSRFRAAIRPSFSRAQVADLDMFEEHMGNLLERIPKNGKTVDLQVLFHEYTMDITTDFLFGCSAGSLLVDASPANREFSDGFSFALGRLPVRSAMGPLMDIIPDWKFDRACKSVHGFIDSLVAQALASREKRPIGHDVPGRYIYLHELADSTTNPAELRDHALNILVAGRDTTASTLSFVFYLLARHPDVWRKLCLEVDLLKGKKPTYEDIRNFRYVNDVINEVLRLYPPVPFNMRVATADTTLPMGGDDSRPILVREGEIVIYSVSSMHRRKDLWGADANEFRPERWECQKQPGFEFLPFNAGPRICLGQNFAMTEVGFTIVRMVQAFESVESRDDRPWVEKLGLTLSSLNGVLVGLRPREM